MTGAALRGRRHAARAVAADDLTFGQVAEEWYRRRTSEGATADEEPFKASTARSVASILRKHLRPALGCSRLADLTPQSVASVARSIGRRLSAKGRKNVLVVLATILADACERDLTPVDLGSRIRFPRVRHHPVEAVPLETVARVAARMPSPYREITLLAAATGMRQGELLAAMWGDVDWSGAIRVTKARDQATGLRTTPKTDAGTRVVAISPGTVAFLREWRERQRALGPRCDFRYLFPAPQARRRQRGASGSVRRRHARRLPVVSPRSLLRAFHAACRTLAVTMRFHDIRHSWASSMIAASGEAALPAVARNLGHASPAVTLGVYSHLLRPALGNLLPVIDAALFSEAPAPTEAVGSTNSS